MGKSKEVVESVIAGAAEKSHFPNQVLLRLITIPEGILVTAAGGAAVGIVGAFAPAAVPVILMGGAGAAASSVVSGIAAKRAVRLTDFEEHAGWDTFFYHRPFKSSSPDPKDKPDGEQHITYAQEQSAKKIGARLYLAFVIACGTTAAYEMLPDAAKTHGTPSASTTPATACTPSISQ